MLRHGPFFCYRLFYVVEIFDGAFRGRKVPSKFSTTLFGVAKSRRNFRRRFSGSQSLVESFDDVFRGRKALSKVTTTLFGVAKPFRKFRRHAYREAVSRSPERNRRFRPRKPLLSSKESIALEKILRFFLQIHKSSLPLQRFRSGKCSAGRESF